MKSFFRISILIICNVFCLLIQGQNSCRYHYYINQAEIASTENLIEKSLTFYDSAFQLNAPMPINIMHAFDESAKIKNFEKCVNYLNLLVETGTDVNEKISSMNFVEEFMKTTFYSNFHIDYEIKLKKRQEQFDTTLINQLRSMINSDQEIRQKHHEKGDTSYYKPMRDSDIKNFYFLKDLVDKYGWPNYKKVGLKYSGVANIVFLHGSRYFSLDSKEWLFFENILKKEIEEGNFYPITLAQYTDQHLVMIEKRNQKFGSLADANQVLFPIEDIENIESLRTDLCLESLKDYIKKKGYSMPKLDE